MDIVPRLLHHLVGWSDDDNSTTALDMCSERGLRAEHLFQPRPNGWDLIPNGGALVYRICLSWFDRTGARIPLNELNHQLRSAGAPSDIYADANSIIAAAAVASSNGSDVESIISELERSYSAASLRSVLTEVIGRDRTLIDSDPEQVREHLVNALQATGAGTVESGLVEAINSPAAIQHRIDGYGARATEAEKGILLGFREFDREVGGLHAGELMVLVGQAKAGKSAFCLATGMNIVDHAEQVGADCDVLFANREMLNARQKERIEAWFVQRLLHKQGDGRLTRRIRDGGLDSDELIGYAQALQQMADMRNTIWMADPRSYDTLDELESIIARFKQKHPIQVVIVDALNEQALGKYGTFISSQWQAMEQITRRLERIAIRHQLVIIAEAQERTEVAGDRHVRLDEVFADASQIRRPISHALRLFQVPGDETLVEAQMIGSRFCATGWSFPLLFRVGDMEITDAPSEARQKIDALCALSRKKGRN